MSASLAKDTRPQVCANALHVSFLFHWIPLEAAAVVVDLKNIRGVLADAVALVKFDDQRIPRGRETLSLEKLAFFHINE